MRRLQADPEIDLAIWGEGVVSAPDLEAGAAQVGDITSQPSPPVLLGVTSPASPGRFWNRNVLVNGDGEVLGVYAKRQPVPFGEYVPGREILGSIKEVGRLVPSDLRRGTSELPLMLGDVGLGTVSSWEVTFARLVRDVAPGSEALVTLTSQATYGWEPVSDQLLRAAQLRAAEHQRSVIVAATTGRSVVIAPDGSRGPSTRLFAADLLVEDVELRSGATPYTRYGDIPVIALGVALLGSEVVRRGHQPVNYAGNRPTMVA